MNKKLQLRVMQLRKKNFNVMILQKKETMNKDCQTTRKNVAEGSYNAFVWYLVP